MFRKKRRVDTGKRQGVESDPEDVLAKPAAEDAKAGSDEDGNYNAEGTADVVDMKEIQKARRLRVGVRADGTSKRKHDEMEEKKSEEENENEKAAKKAHVELAFAKDERANQKSREQEHMEAFIAAKLAEERGEAVPDPNADAAKKPEDAKESAEAQLFAIPEHLKIQGGMQLDDSEKNMNWTQGLAEVEVSTELRVQNMIAAEEAKKKVLEKMAAQAHREARMRQANLNPNTQKLVGQVYGNRFQADYVPKNERSKEATDDDAVRQFRQRTNLRATNPSIQMPQQ
ncbi:unnamed protein product [Amoebophrya sp. A120]|nr:unnamed protein product [Amoebophrya sp. A120]|eukprot:GSA120T00024069001.1